MTRANDLFLFATVLSIGVIAGAMVTSYYYFSTNEEAPIGRVISSVDLLIYIMLLGFTALAFFMVAFYA